MDVNAAMEIASKFIKFLETRDAQLIDKFTQNEIRMALYKTRADRHTLWYKAMEERADELRDNEKRETERNEKAADCNKQSGKGG